MPEYTMEKIVGLILVLVIFVILVVVIGGLSSGTSFWYLGCEGDIGGTLLPGRGYDNPRCNQIKDEINCEISTYKNITRENVNFTVCVWRSGKCYFNPELTCEDFSQTTSPRCQDVPNCKGVSAIGVAVQRLAPAQGEK